MDIVRFMVFFAAAEHAVAVAGAVARGVSYAYRMAMNIIGTA
jgi:hypothetical protein